MLTRTRSMRITCLLLAAVAWATLSSAQDAPAQPCIGVMAPTLAGFDGDATLAGTAMRDLMVKTLSGPMMRPVVLESRVRALAIQEAINAGCSQVVTMALTRKHAGSGSSLGRAVGHAAGSAAWPIPGGPQRCVEYHPGQGRDPHRMDADPGCGRREGGALDSH